MAFRITSQIKQLSRSNQVDKAAFFHALDGFDVNYSVNAFQSQVSNVFEDDEAYKYIITDPYNIPEVTGAVSDPPGSLYVLNGKVLGTGDVIQSLQFEERENRGATYELIYDVSNGGPLSNSPLGMIGTIIFNDFDKSFYGWDGTTWSVFATGDLGDYVKSVVQVGGNITITKGSGEETNIPIGITAGVSGESSLFSQKINFIQGNNMDINISADGTTANVEFAVNQVIAGTMS